MTTPKIKDLPSVDRPREKFVAKGPDALTDTELLAILLGSGIQGKNVKKVAEHILRNFRDKFLMLTVEDLCTIPGIGKAKALQLVAAIALVKRFTQADQTGELTITCPREVVMLLPELRIKRQEHLVCLYLNARQTLIGRETVSIGTLTESLVHPREVFAPALEMRAAGVILVHNHPSGNPEPGPADLQVMNRLVSAGNTLGIKVVDFVIVTPKDAYSCFNRVRDNSAGNTLDSGYIQDGEWLSLSDVMHDEQSGRIQALSDYLEEAIKINFPE